MTHRWRFVGLTAVAAASLIGATASPVQASTGGSAVFVQTNDPSSNSIVAYQRKPDGKLLEAATYATGGTGGRESGSVVDPLASQGSLVLDSPAGLLFAVNAGSDSVSVFSVAGDQLHLDQVVSSRGSFPVGIAVRGQLAYVLNAGLDGSVSGYTVGGGRLTPISGSTRSLGLSNGNPPFFLAAPAEVGFTPTGAQLVVTTKNSGLVDVFSVNPTGRLSDTPTANAIGGVPFAFNFDQSGQLTLVDSGSNSVATYAIGASGHLTRVAGPVPDGQSAACWITAAGGFDYVANAGSGTISQYQVSGGGGVTLVDATTAAVSGAIDMATAGGVLYDQSGAGGSVEVFAIGSDGSLSQVQSVPVPDGSSQEGIVAT